MHSHEFRSVKSRRIASAVVFGLTLFWVVCVRVPRAEAFQEQYAPNQLPPPLWLPAETTQALIEEISGERARTHFIRLKLMGGYAPSPGFSEIARYVCDQAKAYDLKDVRLEEFPSDGERFYWTFLTEPNFDARSGSLWQVTPRRRRLADFAVTPVALACNSRSIKVEAELVYVGAGSSPEDYAGKDVKGKIVLATGEMGAVHEAAVFKRGALGVVRIRTSDYLDRPDLVSGGVLMPWRSDDGQTSTFGFGLSYRQGQVLLADMEKGPVRVRVDIDSTVGPGNYVEVTGVIPGTERPGEEVLLTSHIDHRNSGGNNATGDSVTMEIARALSFLIREGILPKPRRTIRFIWGPEHKGFISYIYHHPEAPNSWLYLINVDMAGKNQSKTGARLHLYRSPHSNPTALDDLVQEVLEWAVAGNRSSIQSRAQMYVWPILDPLGSRDDFLANTVPFWGPSDHEDLNDGSLKVHSVLLNDWPDPFIGAHQDSPETADPTQMKRAAVVVALSLFALANATPHEIEQLAVLSASHAQQRLAAVLRQAILNVSKTDKAALPKKAFDARLALQGALDTELRGLRELDPWLEKNKEAGVHLREISSSLASEGSSLLRDFDSFFRRSAAALGAPLQLPQRSLQEKALRGRIPVRTKSPRGPVNFNRYQYGQAWLAKKLGSWDFLNLDVRRDGQYVPYELLNFVDGRLDLLQIRDAVSAEYGPVPAEHVGAYFDVLVKVGVIEFRSVPESE